MKIKRLLMVLMCLMMLVGCSSKPTALSQVEKSFQDYSFDGAYETYFELKNSGKYSKKQLEEALDFILYWEEYAAENR